MKSKLLPLITFVVFLFGCQPTIERQNGQFYGLADLFFGTSLPSLNYSGSPYILTADIPIADIIPSISGAIVSCESNPALPVGLILNATNCVISGTPTVIQTSLPYTITATNSRGNSSAIIYIAIDANPPSALTYSGSPFTFTENLTISTVVPTYAGTITACSSLPVLPAGLTLSANCQISGTPTSPQSSISYTITGSNLYGGTNSSINIAINMEPLSSLNYASNTYIFTKGVGITPVVPTITGTAISWSISPSLPTGLLLNNTTGELSGTPSVIVATIVYVITATNTSSSITFNLNLTVNDSPPTALSYPGSPFVFSKGVTITSVNPVVTGTPVSYSVSPALPTGLAINTATGLLAGTPSVVAANAVYTVTATNSGGNTTFNMNLTVNDTPPSGLSYIGNPFVFGAGTTILSVNPTVTGTPVSYSVSPALPTGLTINTTTGVLAGTPSVITNLGVYTVTATNTGGNTSFNLTITITPGLPGPITVPSNVPYTSFSISPVGGATGYTWTVPPYATILSGQGTDSITVSYSGTCGTMGDVSVVANSGVGNSPPRVLKHILGQVMNNASAELGNMSFWTIGTDTGNGWIGGVIKGLGFGISYTYGTKSQEIDLVAAGFSSALLDTIPTIRVGEKFGNPPSGIDGFGNSHIKVELRDVSHLPLASWNMGTAGTGTPISNAGSSTTIFKNQFNGYPIGVRYLYWEDGGSDNPRFWNGYFGPGLSQAYVIIGSGCVDPY